jgi:hypothetical protein
LGLGCLAGNEVVELWSRLQDHADAARRTSRRLAFFVDHFDRADESVIVPVNRLMAAFGPSCAWIFAARSIEPSHLHDFWQDHAWLRVELEGLPRKESARFLSRAMNKGETSLKISRQGADVAWKISRGRMQRLRELAELSSIAAEVEGVRQIDSEMIRAVAEELDG